MRISPSVQNKKDWWAWEKVILVGDGVGQSRVDLGDDVIFNGLLFA